VARLFCFDTSTLVHGWVEAYAPTSVPTFWERLASEIDSGSIIAPEEVRQEVTHPDALKAWLRNQRTMFRELSEEMQQDLRSAIDPPVYDAAR